VEKYMKHSAIAVQIAAIFLLTICVTAGESQSNNKIIDSNRAQMLVPFSQVSKDDFVIDVSQGNTEYMNGAISIPYTNFLKDNKLRSKEEISRILRDAGVPCDRPIYIYGKCLPCGGGSAPAEYIYLILKSFGYQVRLLDGSLEQWADSGGHTTGTPSVKPKTNCTPVVRAEGTERGNQTRNAAGNGSKTDEGFAGTVTSQITNANGTLSEDVPYTFEANSTSAQDLNDTVRQFEEVFNESNDINSENFYENPDHNPFRWRHTLQDVSRHGFYKRYGKVLREHALNGESFSQVEMERMNSDWDRVRRNVNEKVSFWEMLRGVLYAKQNKQEDSLKINTPNMIHGTRG
jgi:3-mercaptopyruvate sulfurtransferase SseA